MTINERIFTLLQEKGASQKDLAAYLHIQQTSISSWKRRNTDPPAKYIASIAEYFQVSCHYLLTGEKKEEKQVESTIDVLHKELPADEMTLIEFYRDLKPQVKTYLLKMVAAEIWADEENRLPKAKSIHSALHQNELIG